MIDYSQFPRKNILCVDMKSFYASVSAVTMGLNPMTCYLAVVGNTERQGSVVLAASPALKKIMESRLAPGYLRFQMIQEFT